MHHLTLHTTLVHRWVNQWLHSTTSTFIFIMSPSPTCMNQTIFCNRTPFLSPIPICCYVRHDYDQSHVHRTHEIKDTACLVGAQLVKWYPGRETVTHITSFLQFPSTKSTHRALLDKPTSYHTAILTSIYTLSWINNWNSNSTLHQSLINSLK